MLDFNNSSIWGTGFEPVRISPFELESNALTARPAPFVLEILVSSTIIHRCTSLGSF
jgi:hypothetical protein